MRRHWGEEIQRSLKQETDTEKPRALAACPCLTSLTHEPAAFQLSEAQPQAARRAADSTRQRHAQPPNATGSHIRQGSKKNLRETITDITVGPRPRKQSPRIFRHRSHAGAKHTQHFPMGSFSDTSFLKVMSTRWKEIYCLNCYLAGLNTFFPHLKCRLIKTSLGGHSLGIKKSPPSRWL